MLPVNENTTTPRFYCTVTAVSTTTTTTTTTVNNENGGTSQQPLEDHHDDTSSSSSVVVQHVVAVVKEDHDDFHVKDHASTVTSILRPDLEKKSVFWLDPPVAPNTTTTTTIPYHIIQPPPGHRKNTDVATTTTSSSLTPCGASSSSYECTVVCGHRTRQNVEDDAAAVTTNHPHENGPTTSNTDDVMTNRHCEIHQNDNDLWIKEDFMMAGFQLISNAPQIQVYLVTGTVPTNNHNDNKNYNDNCNASQNSELVEVLLTTVKGIPISSNHSHQKPITVANDTLPLPKLYKTQCVIPGGPRPVRQVRLVFLSLTTTTGTSTSTSSSNRGSTFITANSTTSNTTTTTNDSASSLFLEWIRWTIRIPPPAPTTNTTTNDTTTVMSQPIPTAVPSSHRNVIPSTFPFFSSPPSAMDIASIGSHPNHFDTNRRDQIDSSNCNSSSNKELMMAISGIAMTMRSMEERILKQSSAERMILLQEPMTRLSQQVQSLTTIVQEHVAQQEQFVQQQLPALITNIVQEQLRQQLQSMHVRPMNDIDDYNDEHGDY